MNQPIELSLEQEFSLRTFADQVQQMPREQARIVFADAESRFGQDIGEERGDCYAQYMEECCLTTIESKLCKISLCWKGFFEALAQL